MAGTVDGGKAAAATNKKKYGSDYYTKIGALGGKKGRTGGFYANRELAREWGRIGGLTSKRGKRVVKNNMGVPEYHDNATSRTH